MYEIMFRVTQKLDNQERFKIFCLPLLHLLINQIYSIKENFILKMMKFFCKHRCGVSREKFRTIFDLQYHIGKKHNEINLEFHEIFYSDNDFND